MQIKILKSESKTSKAGKAYKSVSAEVEGKELKYVCVFDNFPGFAELEQGATVEGIIETKEYNGKPSYTLKSAQGGTGGGRGRPDITKAVQEAQATKAESISRAQDRTAMMWAKTNSVELVANHPAYKGLSKEEVEAEIHKLAGLILNDNLDPF